MKKKWQLCNPDINTVKSLCKAFKCSPVTASVLVNRSITSVEDVESFLNPSLGNLRPPFDIKDMDAAVERIYKAIVNNEKILVFGDYDADGITATVILVEFLRYAGAEVRYYIPHRIKEGYGLKTEHISLIANEFQSNLIITVDCGSASHEAVIEAKNSGVDVVITDHHNISDAIPPAHAVVNPKRADCNADFQNLAGVGVAFYLVISLRKYMRDRNFWQNKPEPNLKNFCDLVAIGTVADMVPIVDENRIVIKKGIDVIKTNTHFGIDALIYACGIEKGQIDSNDIAFKLAPMLNAAGRIDHADIAVELLLTKNKDFAKQSAEALQKMNMTRREIEKKVIDEIEEYLKENPDLLGLKSLVLSDQISDNGWHEGVLGIAASTLAKKYFRPVILFSVNGGIVKGSGRSIPRIDLYEILSQCSRSLIGFGGHSMAAGLTIKLDKIDQFKEEFENTIINKTVPEDFIPIVFVDCLLDFDSISDNLLDQLETLEPFGTSNPEPLFMASNIRVCSSKIIGDNHRRMLLKQPGSLKNRLFNAVNFNIDINKPCVERYNQIAYRLRWNRWNGSKTAQLIVEEI